ncbi:MAG: hypothetical protein ACJAS9_001492 [Polaribacter sp.]|jgi:hypothetical protein
MSVIKIILLVNLFPLMVNAGTTNAEKTKIGQSMSNTESTLNKTLLTQIKIVVQKLNKSPISHFEIVKVENKEWTNSALGCPKVGMQYVQVITPGYLVEVKADGITHEVHTSYSHAVVCGPSKVDNLSYRSDKKPKLEESTLNRVKAIQLSRAMLLKTKEIEAKNIRLKSVSDSSINDFSAQCNARYLGNEKGYKVVLSYEKLVVTFFSDGKDVVKCKSHMAI